MSELSETISLLFFAQFSAQMHGHDIFTRQIDGLFYKCRCFPSRVVVSRLFLGVGVEGSKEQLLSSISSKKGKNSFGRI